MRDNDERTTIGIAASSPVFRLGLAQLVAQSPAFDWAGEAQDQEGLLALLENFAPDLVIVDFLSAGFSHETIRLGTRVSPRTRFLAMSDATTSAGILRALRAGLSGYIKKDCDVAEVLEALDATAQGDRFFCGQILDVLRSDQIPLSDMESVALSCDPVVLTDREVQVLGLIAEGMTNLAIAEKLYLSAHTVHTHRKNIMQKLGLKNTAAMVMYAVKAGVVSPNHFLFES